MAIFDRIRKSRSTSSADGVTASAIPQHLLPEVNQRVTVTMGEHVPVPSRVEDLGNGDVQLAYPALPLDTGDPVVVTWERDDAWFSMDTRVVFVDDRSAVPTIRVSAAGRLSRYDERRTDTRAAIELPIELRVVRARAIRPGRELHTYTVEVSSNAVRFVTSAPFAPGDLIEARIQLGDSGLEAASARIRIIRVDAVTGSWRSTCTAAFDEILRSDRARLVALAESKGTVEAASSTAPTADGVGGRDEPEHLGDLHGVVDWLNRRDSTS